MSHRSIKTLHNEQSGIVAFILVIILMLVISLIVLAFSQLVSREQRQALDRQLNAQAFYAAESGVNDAINAIALNGNLLTNDYTSCDNSSTSNFVNKANLTPLLSAETKSSYSCLLVDPTPTKLIKDNVATNQSVVFPIEAKSPDKIYAVKIQWDASSDTASLLRGGCPLSADEFPMSWSDTCEVGMIRVELVTIASGTRTDFLNNRAVVYAVPKGYTSGGSVTFTPFSNASGNNLGETFQASCVGGQDSANPGDQSLRPTCGFLISAIPNMTKGYIRISSIYLKSRVEVQAFKDADPNGTPLELVGAQAAIDVTGRGNDVLKRIKAYVPISQSGQNLIPEYALQTKNTQCKRFNINALDITPDSNLPECDPAN